MVFSDQAHSQISLAGAPLVTVNSETYPLACMDQLQHMLAATRSHDAQGAVILIQITNLAMILSGYGSELTEDVLGALKTSFAQMLGEEDRVIRVQKDQFAILLAQASNAQTMMLCERMQHTMQMFGYHSGYGAMHIMPNIACIFLNDLVSCPETVMNFAYVVLQRSAHTGAIAYRHYEHTPLESAQARQDMGLAGYLLRGLQEDRLRMAYQPVIDSSTGKIAHYEALLRIVGEDGSISSAGALIPIAERMGLIQMIDKMVMQKVIAEIRQHPEVRLAFNVSNVTIDDPSWLAAFRDALSGQPEMAQRVMVEITETAVHRDLGKTAYFVAAIQSTGAQVALDDFGSGYTSFRQLKALSVDVVKIDGSFIRDLADNADNRFFVRTLMEFSKGFGLKTVAEFVETGEVAKLLMEMGVDYMQGYYFGKPENHRSWHQEA